MHISANRTSFCECENCGNSHATESQEKIDEYESDSESDEDTSDEEGETAQADDDNDMD